MGPEYKALWRITYKHGYTFLNLYFHCMEKDIEFMFKQVASKDFMQPIELFSYEMLGEVIDYEEYKPVSIGSLDQHDLNDIKREHISHGADLE